MNKNNAEYVPLVLPFGPVVLVLWSPGPLVLHWSSFGPLVLALVRWPVHQFHRLCSFAPALSSLDFLPHPGGR